MLSGSGRSVLMTFGKRKYCGLEWHFLEMLRCVLAFEGWAGFDSRQRV